MPARRPAAVSISCSVCRVRMTCLQDLLYLSSTVRTRTPPPCPLYPVKPQSSDTRRCAGSNASRTSASETEKSASTATGTVRYGEGGAPGARSQHRHQNTPSFLSVSPSQGELRPFLSDPELVGAGDGSSHISVVLSGRDGYQTLPSRGAAPPPTSIHLYPSLSSLGYEAIQEMVFF